MQKERSLAKLLVILVLPLLLLGGPKSVFASIVFEQTPADDTYNGAILNTPLFVNFGCTLNLDCKISGKTIYNIGVWIKKIGNPADIRLQVVPTWNDPNGGTSIFSNPISTNSISDTEYTLKWFYFPSGIIVGNRYDHNQFFQFQFAEANGTYNVTDYYRVLQHDANDYSTNQQWCKTGWGCASSWFYWKMDDGTVDLSKDQTSTGFSNVLFLPGIEASRLYKTQPAGCLVNCEDQLWEPNTNSDAVDLFLNSDGTSVNPDIYTRDIIKTTNTPITFDLLGQNIYKSFSDMMDGLVASDKITAWQSYVYDWRQSVDDIVNNGTQYKIGLSLQNVSLIDTLQGLVDSSKNTKVTIIAHSNGGLLAKALLKKLEDDKTAGRNNLIDSIDTVILVASPQWGTPSALPAILHGYDQAINPFFIYPFINAVTARALAMNMPGAYGLLPSAEYFNHVFTPVITFVPNILDPYMSKDVATYGQGIASYVGEKSFMIGGDGRNNPLLSDTLKPIRVGSNFIAQAESLHGSIDTMTVPKNIKVVQIAGWGLDTLAGFQYSNGSPCSYPTDNGCTGSYVLDEKPIFTSDGDKTVVTPSALAMAGEKWWLNIKTYNIGFTIDRDHKTIFEAQPVIDFISDLVQSTTTTSSIYLSTTTPVDTSDRLRLSVHSPVTLDAYDISGNHTGKVCPATDTCYIEENIPNSGYYEFGEGKYLNLPADQIKNVKLQGTDAGIFTFDYQTVAPDGTTNTSSFIDIPVTTQTQATTTTNPITQAPQLALDVTGDGVTDFILTPSATFDPITYLQIMKATIDSLDLTQAKKDVFDKRVDNIIKLIQKGKIDKAKLKADKFETVLKNRLAKPDPKKPKPKKLSKTDAQLLLDMLNGLLDNIN